MFNKKGFTLLEVLITTFIFVFGILVLSRIFNEGARIYSDVENTDIAINIARAKMEEIKNTPFANLADSGPAPASSDSASPFAMFDITIDVDETAAPMPVDVQVSWTGKGGGVASVSLETLIADY